jgi:hypothetical protein
MRLVARRKGEAWTAQKVIPHLAVFVPGMLVVGLFLVWAVDDGGYDSSTWYWGALVMLGLSAATAVVLSRVGLRLPRLGRIALALFALYVTWSYVSIAWAGYPGAALEGSNRALLYLLTVALLSALPWQPRSALVALVAFSIGVGVVSVALLVRLAENDRIGVLFQEGRLSAPTGYFNATAALFTMAALCGIALSARREVPGVLRGLLLALATADLDLSLTVQSRGWLFTLPLVALLAILVAGDRVRAAGAAVPVAGGVLLSARRLLHVYQNSPTDPLSRLAVHAARPALLICAGVFFVATIFAWLDGFDRLPALSGRWRRALGTLLALGGAAGIVIAALVVTKGHVSSFISRQWHGFAHEPTTATASHFTDAGSGRYDFWRVALDAFVHHPLGGLGQDNFADYYMLHRQTTEQPQWTHSLELRLLASTGSVGLALFAAFLIVAIVLALRARRAGGGLQRAVAGAALMPLIVWVVHGSVDWFWEIPALSGPALGLLAIGCSLAGSTAVIGEPESVPARRPRRVMGWLVGTVILAAATVVLGLPYLSVREVSIASNLEGSDATVALAHLRTAEKLNPLDSDPGRLAGTIALVNGDPRVALTNFRQSIRQEPGGWFSWLGAGLASSALHRPHQAHQELEVARRINHGDPAIEAALARVFSPHPIGAIQDLRLLPPLA